MLRLVLWGAGTVTVPWFLHQVCARACALGRPRLHTIPQPTSGVVGLQVFSVIPSPFPRLHGVEPASGLAAFASCACLGISLLEFITHGSAVRCSCFQRWRRSCTPIRCCCGQLLLLPAACPDCSACLLRLCSSSDVRLRCDRWVARRRQALDHGALTSRGGGLCGWRTQNLVSGSVRSLLLVCERVLGPWLAANLAVARVPTPHPATAQRRRALAGCRELAQQAHTGGAACSGTQRGVRQSRAGGGGFRDTFERRHARWPAAV